MTVAKRLGWQLYAGWRTEEKELGRPEGLPRTAAITRNCGRKKSACNRGRGAVAPFRTGRQTRSRSLPRLGQFIPMRLLAQARASFRKAMHFVGRMRAARGLHRFKHEPFRFGTATARGQASLGGSSTRVGRPGRKEPGTLEGIPRTHRHNATSFALSSHNVVVALTLWLTTSGSNLHPT
jgi:hypothetical protein